MAKQPEKSQNDRTKNAKKIFLNQTTVLSKISNIF
jgi:hypothetical protein